MLVLISSALRKLFCNRLFNALFDIALGILPIVCGVLTAVSLIESINFVIVELSSCINQPFMWLHWPDGNQFIVKPRNSLHLRYLVDHLNGFNATCSPFFCEFLHLIRFISVEGNKARATEFTRNLTTAHFFGKATVNCLPPAFAGIVLVLGS